MLWDKYGNEIEVLKEQVRSMVVAGGRKAAEQMNLINVLERLGVSYHFEKEIEEQLEQLFAKFEDNEDYDLFTIALHFRIFRQHGYKMSCVGDMVNGNAEPTRHLAKFPPSLWGDRFTSFTFDKLLWEKYGNEIEVLKEQVRSMVVAGGRKAAEQINLINVLERLGVSYHFEKEIEEQLEQLFAKFEDNEDYDLFTIALHFRIFRQHGYKMSCG
ncbi:unnamed protein product [Camellia sinensis]